MVPSSDMSDGVLVLSHRRREQNKTGGTDRGAARIGLRLEMRSAQGHGQATTTIVCSRMAAVTATWLVTVGWRIDDFSGFRSGR
jgi:hypothetical protein